MTYPYNAYDKPLVWSKLWGDPVEQADSPDYSPSVENPKFTVEAYEELKKQRRLDVLEGIISKFLIKNKISSSTEYAIASKEDLEVLCLQYENLIKGL